MRMRAMAAASMARRAGALIGGAGKLAAGVLLTGCSRRRMPRSVNSENCPRVWKLAGRVVRLILKRWDRFVADRALLSPPFVGGKAQKMAEKLRFELMRLERFYAASACHAR